MSLLLIFYSNEGFLEATFDNSGGQTASIVNGKNMPMEPRWSRWPHAMEPACPSLHVYELVYCIALQIYIGMCMNTCIYRIVKRASVGVF